MAIWLAMTFTSGAFLPVSHRMWCVRMRRSSVAMTSCYTSEMATSSSECWHSYMVREYTECSALCHLTGICTQCFCHPNHKWLWHVSIWSCDFNVIVHMYCICTLAYTAWCQPPPMASLISLHSSQHSRAILASCEAGLSCPACCGHRTRL